MSTELEEGRLFSPAAFYAPKEKVQLAGGALTLNNDAEAKLLDSLVKNLFMPILEYIPGTANAGYHAWQLGKFKIGLFLAELISFLLITLAVFIVIVKVMGAMMKRVEPPKPGEPTTKECPFCLSMIPLKATVCAHCTCELPAPQAAPPAS